MATSRSVVYAVLALTLASHLTELEAQSKVRWPEGKRVAVSLSFDDARTSQVDTGLALLKRHGVKATFYVNPRNTANRIDGWKQLAKEGHEIGNHTNSHPCTVNYPWSQKNALENYTLATMAAELDSTNAAIERTLGVKATTFAYPCGDTFIGRGAGTKSYVPLIAERFLAGRGFRDGATNDPALCDLAQVRGTDFDGMTFEEMKALIETAAKEGRWVAFAGHEIGEPGRFQTTSVPALEQLIRYAKDPANGVWLRTIAEVAGHIRTQQAK